MKTIFAVVILAFATPSLSAQTQQPTRDLCTSHVVMVGQHPEKLQSLSFRDLFVLEKEMFACSQVYKEWSFSLADATITQLQLRRCEEFISEHNLDDAFFKEDEDRSSK